MKKFLKGVRFFLCYLAITLATATGVVLVSQNNEANINGNNNNGNIVATDDNHLMDVVTELMEMKSASISLSVSLETSDIPAKKVDLDLALDLLAENNFSTIEANGEIDLNIYEKSNNEFTTVAQEKILLTYKDNNIYLSALGGNFCLNTDNLITAISSALELFDVTIPSLGDGDFDPTSLLGYMGEYTEKETEDNTKLDVSLEFFGIKIKMSCDILKQTNEQTLEETIRYIPTSIIIEDAEIEGLKISANINLELNKEVNITIPDKTFVNIDNVTRIFNQLNTIKQNGFVSAKLHTRINNNQLDFDILADFADSLKASISTPSLSNLTLKILGDDTFLSFGNIKVKTTKDDITNLINFISIDLKDLVSNFNPQIIVDVESKVEEIINGLKNSSSNIDLQDIIAELNNITISDDCISYISEDISVIINFENNNITSITINYQDFDIALDSISLEKQTIQESSQGFVNFSDLFPVVKKLANTISTNGASGKLTATFGEETLNVNFGLKNGSYVLGNINTTILGHNLSIITKNTTAFVSIDNINFTTNIDEIDTIISYLNETFGLNVSLDSSAIDFNIDNIDLSIIKSLKAIDNGLEINIADTYITILTNRDYISKIIVSNKDFGITIKLSAYGDIALDSDTAKDYLTFSDITKYIDNTLAFTKNNAFEISGSADVSLDDTSINVTADIKLAKDKLTATINLSYNSTTYTLDAYLDNDTLVLSYDGLNVEFNSQTISLVKDFIKTILPKYVDIDSLLNKINIDSIQESLEATAIDYKVLIEAISSLSLTKNTFTTRINLNKLISQNVTLGICLKDLGSKYNLAIDASIDDIFANLDINATGLTGFEVNRSVDTIKVNDYLSLLQILDNTIYSRNIKLNTNIKYKSYDLDLTILVDARKDFRLSITTDRLGSNLTVTYVQNTIYIAFGNLKVKFGKDDINTALNFVNQDLRDLLAEFGVIFKELNINDIISSANSSNISFEVIKQILLDLSFRDDGIDYSNNGLTLNINTENDKLNSISIDYKDLSVALDITNNTQDIIIPQTTYNTLADIINNIKAITNSIATKAIGGDIQVNINDYIFTGNFKLNYINDVLIIEIDVTAYSQHINVIYYNETIYATIKDLPLRVSYSERYEFADYLNNKFGLNIDIDKIIKDIESAIAKTESTPSQKDINVEFVTNLVVNSNGFTLTIGNDVIDFATQTTNDKQYISSISYNNMVLVNNFTFANDALITTPQDKDYATYKTFAKYFDEVERLINASKDTSTDQYILSGNANLYKLNSAGSKVYIDGQEDKISLTFDNMRFDATPDKNLFTGYISATGFGSLYTNYLGRYNHTLTAHFDSNFIFLDYNGLRVKFSKQSNSEFINSLKNIVTHYLSGLSFSEDILEIFDMIRFDTMGNLLFNDIDISKLLKDLPDYIPMLKTLRLNQDNSLDIGIDISSFVPEFTEEILITAKLDSNNKLSLVINGLKLPGDVLLDFTINVDTASPFSVNPQESYMDMTSIGKLLNTFDKTIQKTTTDNKTYEAGLSGKLHIDTEIIGIKIKEDVPFTMQLNVDTQSSGSPIEAKVYLDIPSISILNGTTKLYTTLYITDRLEGEPILYIHRTGKELKSKYKVSEIGNNIVKIIADITNISESMLNTLLSMEIEYIDGPSKAENILKDYIYTASGAKRNFYIGLDLRQLTLMDMMLGYSEDNLTSMTVTSNNDVLETMSFSNISLKAMAGVYIYASANIDFSKITEIQDIASEIKSIDATEYGGWDDGSLVINFIENGGSDVSNKMVQKGRSITLPTPIKEVENGNTLEVYTFLGWCRNQDLTDAPITGDFLMDEDCGITFYAKWELQTIYTKHTITFVDNILNTDSTISGYNGYNIASMIPQKDSEVTIHYEELGQTAKYTFDGWYYGEIVDGQIVYGAKFEMSIMPNEDITLYAKYTEISRTYQRKLAIYDGEKELFLDYYVDGAEINILSLVSHKEDTLWYKDASFTQAYDTLPEIMPSNDLTIYVRNKYTLTFKSTFGDKETKTVVDYQGSTFSTPTQISYEQTIYNGDIPNYLEAYIFGGYKLSSNNQIEVPSVMPNQNMTFDAVWEYQTLSYVKLTFDTSWVKPDSWWFGCSEVTAPTVIADKYVLNGSILSGTTLTKVTSILNPDNFETEEVRATTKYKYAITYNFKASTWNTTECKNHNTLSFDITTTTITKNTTFYVEWESGTY